MPQSSLTSQISAISVHIWDIECDLIVLIVKEWHSVQSTIYVPSVHWTPVENQIALLSFCHLWRQMNEIQEQANCLTKSAKNNGWWEMKKTKPETCTNPNYADYNDIFRLCESGSWPGNKIWLWLSFKEGTSVTSLLSLSSLICGASVHAALRVLNKQILILF